MCVRQILFELTSKPLHDKKTEQFKETLHCAPIRSIDIAFNKNAIDTTVKNLKNTS